MKQQRYPLFSNETFIPETTTTTPTATTTTTTTTPEQQQQEDANNVLQTPSLAMGRLIVLGAAAIYGTNFASVKMLDSVMPLAASAALRFSLAAAAVTGVVLWQEQQDDDDDGEQKWGATLAGAEVGWWYFLGYISQAFGLIHSDASKSAFFNALAVVVVPILDAVVRGRNLSLRKVLSILIAIGGTGLVELAPKLDPSIVTDGAFFTSSDLFCFSQAFFFGFGYWRLEDASNAYPEESGRNTAGQLLAIAMGSVLFWFGSMVYDGTSLVDVASNLQTWLSDPFILKGLVWTGLVSTALAVYLETVALQVVSATELTILMTSVSLWGSAFAYVTMGETISPIGMVGGLMILCGCALSALSSPSEEEATKLP